MRIRNDGKCTIIFNGGTLEPKMVGLFKGDAEKIGNILLSRYKFLVDLDNLKDEVVEVKTIEPVAAKTTAKKTGKKSKK